MAMMAIGTGMSVAGGAISQNESQANARRIAEARNRVLEETRAKQKAYAAVLERFINILSRKQCFN